MIASLSTDLSGAVRFEGNIAGGAGGVIVVPAGGSATVRGRVAFVRNSAGAFGGAISFRGSLLNVTEQVVFDSNACTNGNGGAIDLKGLSNLIIRGDVLFRNNSAITGFGGAVGAVGTGSVILLGGAARLEGNSGVSGGAINLGVCTSMFARARVQVLPLYD